MVGPWFCYLVVCADGSLYTGITTDLARRVREHNLGTGSRYTRCRRPVRLVYAEPQPDRGEATRREREIKDMRRERKQALRECWAADASLGAADLERCGDGGES